MLLLLLQLPPLLLSEELLSSDGEALVRNQAAGLGRIPLRALRGRASELGSRSLLDCGGEESLTFVERSIEIESEFGILLESEAAKSCRSCDLLDFRLYLLRHSRKYVQIYIAKDKFDTHRDNIVYPVRLQFISLCHERWL